MTSNSTRLVPGNKNTSRHRCLLLVTSFSITVTLVWFAYLTQWSDPVQIVSLMPESWAEDSKNSRWQRECPDVLSKMTRGRWHQQEMTSSQRFELNMFYVKVHTDHGLPIGLQRPDLKCGNVTFGPYAPPMHPLLWYRALCDQDGTTPCCYHNRCRNLALELCDCAECYDMRREVLAEYALWRPEDSRCSLEEFSVEKICKVLEGATLYFIGDSFVRHVYTALLLAARGDEMSGAILPYAPSGMKAACHGIYMFTEKRCRHWLHRKTSVCHGKTQLRFFEYMFVKEASEIHSTIVPLRNIPRSFVFIGTGIHDNFNAAETKAKILKPLMEKLKNSTYPRILWAATHAPGLLKTPRVSEQSAKSVQRYNEEVRRFLAGWNVSVFDTYNLTSGVMSFDGAHYGLGVNKVKVRVLLSYLLELHLQREW